MVAMLLFRKLGLASVAFSALALAACDQGTVTASSAPAEKAAAQPELAPNGEEYGEFIARPAELAQIATNEIMKSLRLSSTAKMVGMEVYNRACASCHGADLKGSREQGTPDLTDTLWRFAGDDAATGGATIYPSDIEWTVRYGIRSGHANMRGSEANMVAFDPQYRLPKDTEEYGAGRFLTDEEISDVVEYVLKISGQQADAAKAAHGDELFHDGTKGNCNDCHENEGVGNLAIGSTNLTAPNLYLYGADRAAITESIVRGRAGMMPAFEGQLKPEEIKAVAIYIYYRALPPP
jgi:cytochrome c oxidase cbb3-type subunit III